MLESMERLKKYVAANTDESYVLTSYPPQYRVVCSTMINDLIDAVEREVEEQIEERYIELPKDENGETIHVGDKLHPWNDREEVIEVRAIIDSNAFATCDSEIHFLRCNDPSVWVHHKSPAVEDVLREFALEIDPSADVEVSGAKTIAEYAKRLKLKEAE